MLNTSYVKMVDAWMSYNADGNREKYAAVYNEHAANANACTLLAGRDKLYNALKLYEFGVKTNADTDGKPVVKDYIRKLRKNALVESDFPVTGEAWTEYKELSNVLWLSVCAYNKHVNDKPDATPDKNLFNYVRRALSRVCLHLKTVFDIGEKVNINASMTAAFLRFAVKKKATGKGEITFVPVMISKAALRELAETVVRVAIKGISLDTVMAVDAEELATYSKAVKAERKAEKEASKEAEPENTENEVA